MLSKHKMSRYPIYTYANRQNAQALHQIQGAMILLGGMLFVLGFLLINFEMMALGSGFMVSSACFSVCEMNDPYHTDSYHGRSYDELEKGEELEVEEGSE